MAAASWHL